MDVVLVEESGFNPELAGMTAGIADGRSTRFLHDLAQLAGQDQITLAFHDGDFDRQQIAADAGHRGARRHPDLVLLFGKPILVARHTQIGLDIVIADRDVLGRRIARQLSGGLAGERTDLAFEIAHPRFAGVFTNQSPQRVLGQRQLFVRNPMRLHGFRNEIALGDLQFLDLGISRDLDDFHAVAQRWWNRFQHIGGRNENDLGEIERHFQIVIGEGRILFGIEHFQQR